MTVYEQPVAGPAAAALASLTPAQLTFIHSLPKAELHAHLNGSIPIALLQKLAQKRAASLEVDTSLDAAVRSGLDRLQSGVELNEIHDFFGLFRAIYALTDRPETLRECTRAVLEHFLNEEQPQAQYLELRTTPRETEHMTLRDYLVTVLQEVEAFGPEQAGLIVSVSREMKPDAMERIVALAIQLRKEGSRVVGLDLCGNPLGGDATEIASIVHRAKEAGLSTTVHIAETIQNTNEDTKALLSCQPDRLGHATFLDEDALLHVLEKKIPVELCLSSNLLCKTVPSLEDHHIKQYLAAGHPIAICTDDILPFRTTLTAEYALLLAAPPLGLGLGLDEVRSIAENGMASRFKFS